MTYRTGLLFLPVLPVQHVLQGYIMEPCASPKLILGTVQLGMPYGIANTAGQPDRATARRIVQAALENGITCFDTAQAYGDSESVLGAVLKELGASHEVRIASKLAATLDLADPAAVEAAVNASMSRLRTDRLWCMLLHRVSALDAWDQGLGPVLRHFQAEGRIEQLGVSLNTVADAPVALAHPDMAVIQAPCNAWDRRMRERGFLKQARGEGRLCCIRSIYLQGLLTMTPEAVACRLPAAYETAGRWWRLAGELAVPPKELAMRYALSLQAPLVIGAESPEQVEDTAHMAADLAPLTPQDIQTIASAMDPLLNETIIEPWRWESPAS